MHAHFARDRRLPLLSLLLSPRLLGSEMDVAQKSSPSGDSALDVQLDADKVCRLPLVLQLMKPTDASELAFAVAGVR